MTQAKCIGDQWLFFAHECTEACRRRVKGTRGCERVEPLVTEAKAICETCPVNKECRTWSVLTALQHGIAGGLTELERKRVRRNLKKQGYKLAPIHPPRRLK